MYDNTLNLPRTDFAMRAGLPTREVELVEANKGIYAALMEANKDKPRFILHDGPPYANGDIHIGHALNKILKDFIIRYKNMSGFCAPYVPGWDTHGLPTELQAIKKGGLDRHTTDVVTFRKKCEEFACFYADNQNKQFQRLLALGDWDHPYMTLRPEFEAKQIRIFGSLANRGLIYKGLRPVYWCPVDQTALAEAEIEYAEDPCTSVYVKFAVEDDKGLFGELGDLNRVYFVIWTTTVWTLPGNVAICLAPDFTYDAVRVGEETYILAHELVEATMKAASIETWEVVASYQGADLEGMLTRHPFMDRQSLVIVGDHVTAESGTGCVHTAPGHGVEDFVVCRNYPQLSIPVPVDDRGYLNEQAGPFAGLYYEKANEAIFESLQTSGALLASEKIIHQYPHCWRCKNPVIFRATEQWFCSLDAFKEQAVEEIRKVEWIPGWGEERIAAMVRERSDWCISRQRVWGVPIPIFYCEDCGEALISEQTIDAVAKLFEKEGSNAWYLHTPEEILGKAPKCAHCGSTKFRKEKDIMDVWFDSGSSHSGVLDTRDDLSYPADVYLEGNDQYRGWFQSSLLTAVSVKGSAPYRTVITHGMVVDGDGKKMSKSIGNVIVPADVVKEYGADILRLWVSSVDYTCDTRISKEILKQLAEIYRKIRNTARFMLGNLGDFDPAKDAVPYEALAEADRFALLQLYRLINKVRYAYEHYEFHQIYHSVHNFCVTDMSNFYMDIAKDTLYAEQASSPARRAVQTALYTILDALTRLLAPILPFTTEEIRAAMPGTSGSVMLAGMPEADETWNHAELATAWEAILSVREDVKKALELARASKLIGSSLEASVTLHLPASSPVFSVLDARREALPGLFITSAATLTQEAPQGDCFHDCITEGLSVSVARAEGEKCARCWMILPSVGQDAQHPALCARCAALMAQKEQA
ncbi:MAG: isoleucine--tRNA ligase [Clostridia bacterium]|nr:isoleucine--tRNA ligase [Clostridia bacterium]